MFHSIPCSEYKNASFYDIISQLRMESQTVNIKEPLKLTMITFAIY